MKYYQFIINCLVLSITALLPTGYAAQKTAGELSITPYVFENSKQEKVDAEFGELTVPENRKIRNSRLIKLGFVRLKPRPRIRDLRSFI